MPDESALDLDSRRRIYARVEREPGVYLRELQRALDMPMGMLEYHLGRLADAGLVTVREDAHKRFFPASMGVEDKRYLALLRQDACRRIVVHLLEHKDATRAELRAATGLPETTLDHYLGKLLAAGLATRAEDARPHRHALTKPEVALRLLVRYQPTFMDRVLDRVLDAMDAVQVRE